VARRYAQFDAAMDAIAAPVAHAARARETLPDDPLLARLGRSLGLARGSEESASAAAGRAMAARVDGDLRACTDALIAVHGLAGGAAAEAFARADAGMRRDAPLDEGKAAMMGGLVTGALSGLTADLATGGLTLGGGMLAGALLGALGGAGVARGMNVARERTTVSLSWDDAFLDALVEAVLLRYLAVAHFGRGRGDWQADAPPGRWREVLASVLDGRRATWTSLWARRLDGDDAAFTAVVRAELAHDALAALDALYPDAARPRRSPPAT